VILVRLTTRERPSAVDAPRLVPFINEFVDLFHLSRKLGSAGGTRNQTGRRGLSNGVAGRVFGPIPPRLRHVIRRFPFKCVESAQIDPGRRPSNQKRSRGCVFRVRRADARRPGSSVDPSAGKHDGDESLGLRRTERRRKPRPLAGGGQSHDDASRYQRGHGWPMGNSAGWNLPLFGATDWWPAGPVSPVRVPRCRSALGGLNLGPPKAITDVHVPLHGRTLRPQGDARCTYASVSSLEAGASLGASRGSCESRSISVLSSLNRARKADRSAEMLKAELPGVPDSAAIS
jgi:hypothetical protein